MGIYQLARALALCLAFAAPVQSATILTGDRIDGTPVIERLDTADLAPGQIHRFWFRAGETALAQGWYVPVIIIKGAHPGQRLLLTAAIHGDELSGIAVIHRLAAEIDPASLSGTIIAIPGLNTPGLMQSAREFTTGNARDADNLNRVMPGDPAKGGASGYAARLWTNLMRPNADAAVDMHTQSRGTAYPLYAFASTPRTRRMAELIGPDILKLDPGTKGTVENELTWSGVPAITLEIGRPEVFDPVLVARSVEGLKNLMREMGMQAGAVTPPPPAIFTANTITPVPSPRAGYATLLTPLGSDVVKGQPLATIADPFGRVVETVRAPVAGRINTIFTDPRREKGSLIVRIVAWSDNPKCKDGC